jgi:hypothetical protein
MVFYPEEKTQIGSRPIQKQGEKEEIQTNEFNKRSMDISQGAS